MRVAMGGSHSVHLLMTINLHRVGQVLWSQRQLLVDQTVSDNEDEEVTASALESRRRPNAGVRPCELVHGPAESATARPPDPGVRRAGLVCLLSCS